MSAYSCCTSASAVSVFRFAVCASTSCCFRLPISSSLLSNSFWSLASASSSRCSASCALARLLFCSHSDLSSSSALRLSSASDLSISASFSSSAASFAS